MTEIILEGWGKWGSGFCCHFFHYAPNFEKVGGHIGFGLSVRMYVCMYVCMYVFMFEISS